MAENLKLAKALRETKSFFQGASNAAASNVSAPVDAIAWALRKAGVPVGDAPMGGSDWMRQHGLTAEAPSASGLIGESVGGVAPIVASAKAAQIAKGLLQAGENLAAPATMNPQAGAIVFHGSPHKFEAFDASKIGTGEGAQAYGHGLYLADSQDLAKSYANKLTQVDGRAISDQLDSRVRYLNLLKEQAAAGDVNAAKNVPVIEKSIAELQNQGSVYKVDLPDEAIAKMLDWDKPLSQQAPEVREMVRSAFPPTYINGRYVNPLNSQVSGREMLDQLGMIANKRGEPGFRQAEPMLRQAGIPGIRYLDAGSRGQGQGSSNFVVFPGNEGLLTIVERNGQLLGTK